MEWKKRCHNFLITFAILNMNKYDRYLINFQSELLGNTLLPDPVIFFTMKFNKIEREWRRASKITSWGKIEANSLKHAIPPCRLAYGEFKSVFGNYFLCGERWLETRLWAYAKHNYENHKYHHEIDTWNRRKRATRCVPMDASSHLYKRVSLSVHPSVRPLVCPSVRPSVRRSIIPLLMSRRWCI